MTIILITLLLSDQNLKISSNVDRRSKKTKQKYGHYGLGVDQHQKIDNYTMGLNSWKIAPNERGDKKGVPGLSCFQPH